MSMKAVVSEKGQVTIPKPLRDRLGIRPGEVLEFREEHGRLVAEKVRSRHPVDDVYGLLADGTSTDALIHELRGGV
jgi:antitoxin PrlF